MKAGLLSATWAWLVLLAHTAPLSAQDSVPKVADTLLTPVDTLRPGVSPDPADSITYAKAPFSPMGAFWRSLLVPGWAQAKLNRKLTGALFIAWEGVTIGMALKTTAELHYLQNTGSGSTDAKKKEQQDWLVLLGFNHLLSAIEAYVATHLWDFPADLEIRAIPTRGGAAATISVPLP